MITRMSVNDARQRTARILKRAGIVLTDAEQRNIEIADFGLGDLERYGIEVVTYVNTDHCCAKELVLFPWQICLEHRHPEVDGRPGKEETFRCRSGQVYLYVPGTPTEFSKARVPEERLPYLTVWHEIVLNPGEQYTLAPNTLHWFQAGPDGAIVSEFSTHNVDEADIFTDPQVVRVP